MGLRNFSYHARLLLSCAASLLPQPLAAGFCKYFAAAAASSGFKAAGGATPVPAYAEVLF